MKIKCPGCSRLLNIPDSAAGKVVKCPCGKQLKAPGGAANQPAAPQPTAPAQPAAPAQPQAPAAPAQPQPPAPAAPAQPGGGQAPPPWMPAGSMPPQHPASFVDDLTDNDFAPMRAVATPGRQEQKQTAKADPLAKYVPELEQEKKEKKKEFVEGASRHVWQSIGLLVLLGCLGIGFNTFLLLNVEDDMQYYVEEEDFEESDGIKILRGILIMKIAISSMFLVCAAFIFKFPMISSFFAIVCFVLSEILGLILWPIDLINIRRWIARAVMFGAFVQAINNAAYYKYVMKGGRDED